MAAITVVARGGMSVLATGTLGGDSNSLRLVLYYGETPVSVSCT